MKIHEQMKKKSFIPKILFPTFFLVNISRHKVTIKKRGEVSSDVKPLMVRMDVISLK